MEYKCHVDLKKTVIFDEEEFEYLEPTDEDMKN